MTDTTAIIRQAARLARLGAVVAIAAIAGAISPVMPETVFDGPGIMSFRQQSAIPQLAPTGYLIEGRYADPPIIRYVPQLPSLGSGVTRAAPAM